jgi:hypothetical protein
LRRGRTPISPGTWMFSIAYLCPFAEGP